MKTTTRLMMILLVLGLVIAACESTPEETDTASPAANRNENDTAAATAVPDPTTEPTAVPTLTSTPALPLVTGTDDFPWWNDAVFYQIFVRSFYDSDGDGIGDLNGLIEKLDYLNDGDTATQDDLGVTGIWLMPIFESPSYHGYDVTDYTTVNPDYGTNEDFLRLMDEAHRRGIRVIIDLPLNHTSVDHPWFVESASSPDSEFRDWYIWVDENPGYRGPSNQPVWHNKNGSFYYAVFWDGMPDLNLDNEDVTTAIFEVVVFWLQEMGADGFRLDGVKHLYEEGELQENVARNHEWLMEFYQLYKDVAPDAFTVGEIWSPTSQVKRYIEPQNELDIAFEFDLAAAILDSVRGGFAKQYLDQMERVIDAYPAGQYGTFLANHDMDRTLSQLGEDEGKARIAATLQLTSPGVPFIYYGEEIGMTGVKPDEDIRRPFQWASDSISVGFTEGVPWRAPAPDYETRSVALQEADPDSLLNHYDTLIQLRNEHEALRIGEWTEVNAGNGRLAAYLRHTNEEIILVLVNISSQPMTDYALSLKEGPLSGGANATLLFGSGEPTAPSLNDNGGFEEYNPLAELPGHSSTVIRLSP